MHTVMYFQNSVPLPKVCFLYSFNILSALSHVISKSYAPLTWESTLWVDPKIAKYSIQNIRRQKISSLSVDEYFFTDEFVSIKEMSEVQVFREIKAGNTVKHRLIEQSLHFL